MPAAPDAPLLVTLGLGLVLGLKHALDADHVVAVAAIASRSRSLWRSSVVGVWWGLGHSVALLLASAGVILMRRAVPARAVLALEVAVGAMLVLLGLDLLRKVHAGKLRHLRLHAHRHEHDGAPHTHLHVHEGSAAHTEHQEHHVGRRPFLVGLLHGLAGSAALTLVVLSTIASPWAGLLYVLVFGAGTLLGMLAVSTLVGLPFALASRAAGRLSTLSTRIQVLAALGSIGFGLWYAWAAARLAG